MAADDTGSMFDTSPDEREEARLDADAEIEAGHGVPHDRVRDWLSKPGEGQRAPTPKA